MKSIYLSNLDFSQLQEFSQTQASVPNKKETLKKIKNITQAKSIAQSVICQASIGNININHIIDCIKRELLTTWAVCVHLKISPGTFLRLRKKYNIHPLFVSKIVPHQKHNTNYYCLPQLLNFPEIELKNAQKRKKQWLCPHCKANNLEQVKNKTFNYRFETQCNNCAFHANYINEHMYIYLPSPHLYVRPQTIKITGLKSGPQFLKALLMIIKNPSFV